jgi:hypothetical protein
MSNLQLKINAHNAQESVSSAGALATDVYSSIMTDGSSGTYTLADPSNSFGNHGLYKVARNDSAVSHTLTPSNFSGGTSMTCPAGSEVYLLWCYDDDESYAGEWGLIRHSGGITINA